MSLESDAKDYSLSFKNVVDQEKAHCLIVDGRKGRSPGSFQFSALSSSIQQAADIRNICWLNLTNLQLKVVCLM